MPQKLREGTDTMSDSPKHIVAIEGIHPRDSLPSAIQVNPILLEAMKKIARGRGRPDGRPYNGDDARQIMRTAMAQCGIDW